MDSSPLPEISKTLDPKEYNNYEVKQIIFTSDGGTTVRIEHLVQNAPREEVTITEEDNTRLSEALTDLEEVLLSQIELSSQVKNTELFVKRR
jgi:hypothetical protein